MALLAASNHVFRGGFTLFETEILQQASQQCFPLCQGNVLQPWLTWKEKGWACTNKAPPDNHEQALWASAGSARARTGFCKMFCIPLGPLHILREALQNRC